MLNGWPGRRVDPSVAPNSSRVARRRTARTAVARHRRCRRALHDWPGHMAVGEHRWRERSRRRARVRGYKEEGTTTTPFDMTVLNDLDRYRLAMDVLARVERMRDDATAGRAVAHFKAKRSEHREYVVQHGDDTPEVRNWRWKPAP